MKGQGCLYRRNKTWWIGYGGPTGYVRESSGSENRADALDLLKRRQADVLGGWNPASRQTTVSDLLDLVLRDYEMHGRASLSTARGAIEQIRITVGDVKAERIRYSTLQVLVQRWQSQGKAPATINRTLAVLRRAYTLGQMAGLVQQAPAFPHLREDNARQGFVEQEQLSDLLGRIEDQDTRDLVAWLSVTGMRVGEAKRLEWRHVFANEVRIPAGITKNRQDRVLPIVGPLAEIVDRRRAARRLECPFIFHRAGKPIKDFRATWATACRRDGRSGLLVHDLRRSALRTLRQNGIPEEIAMRISGHKTASVFRRYRIVTTGEVAAALESVPRLTVSS